MDNKTFQNKYKNSPDFYWSFETVDTFINKNNW